MNLSNLAAKILNDVRNICGCVTSANDGIIRRRDADRLMI